MADPWAAAEANVAVKYDPQQAALQRQLDMAKANTIGREQSLNEYGQAGRGIIGDTYNTLYGLLGQNRTQQAADLAKQVGNVNAGYDEAVSSIQGWQAKSRDYLNQMAQQLGQSGAGLINNTELENLVNTNLGRAQFAKANYGGNLSEWAAKMDSLLGMGIDTAHQSEAQRKANFEAELVKAIGANKLAGTEQETDIMGRLADILGLRQNDLIAMYDKLSADQWQRDFQQAQLDEQAAEHAAEMAYKYSALNASSGGGSGGGSSGYDVMDWAKLAMAQQKEATANGQWAQEFELKKQAANQPDSTNWATLAPLYMNSGAFGGGFNPATQEFDPNFGSGVDLGTLSDFIENGPRAITTRNSRLADEAATNQRNQETFNIQNLAGNAMQNMNQGGGGSWMPGWMQGTAKTLGWNAASHAAPTVAIPAYLGRGLTGGGWLPWS